MRQTGARNIQQSVLLVRVHGYVVITAIAGVDELDPDFLLVGGIQSFDVAVTPSLERIGGRLAATLFHRTIIGTAGRMGFDFVRRPVHDVDASTVGAPSRPASREVLVGVGNAPVMLFLELVLFGVRSGIAPLPELLDKCIALFVIRQRFEGGQLFRRDDPTHVFVEPLLVRGTQFDLELLGVGLLLLRAQVALQRIGLAGTRRGDIGVAGTIIRDLLSRFRTARAAAGADRSLCSRSGSRRRIVWHRRHCRRAIGRGTGDVTGTLRSDCNRQQENAGHRAEKNAVKRKLHCCYQTPANTL